MTNSTLPNLSLPTEVLWKIFGLIPDSESKTHFSLTCKDFNAVAHSYKCFVEEGYKAEQMAYVDATIQRGLNEDEVAKCGISPPTPSCGGQLAILKRALAAEIALDKFFNAFKRRCTQLHADQNHVAFEQFCIFVIKGLEKQLESVRSAQSGQDQDVIRVKSETAVTVFYKKIYYDMVETFASQPAASITPQSYDEKAKEIGSFFGGNSMENIEASLRVALLEEHGQAFTALCAEYIDPSPDNPKVAQIQVQLRTKFEADEKIITAEVAILRGSTGWNGAIHEAYQEMQAAQVALEMAKTEFLGVNGNTYRDIRATAAIDTLLALSPSAESQDLQSAAVNLEARDTEFQAAKREYDDLVAKLKELVQYDRNGNIVGGKLAAVRTSLMPFNLANAAREEAKKIDGFYRELSILVTTNTISTRYHNIHRFIAD